MVMCISISFIWVISFRILDFHEQIYSMNMTLSLNKSILIIRLELLSNLDMRLNSIFRCSFGIIIESNSSFENWIVFC
ncbi:hypothetical protein H5410_033279 [Solanum commersonii]|uniref:Uncharacterized protein n=1 Tax=Solanum commersonii TaxID=4109 RepID=A0A9J5YPP8_SOLCO|nr:hypothetical protein H5410_033279 [Solanum commersonii]